MAAAHNEGYVHSALELSNIFVKDEKSTCFTCKISDHFQEVDGSKEARSSTF